MHVATRECFQKLPIEGSRLEFSKIIGPLIDSLKVNASRHVISIDYSKCNICFKTNYDIRIKEKLEITNFSKKQMEEAFSKTEKKG